MERCTPVAVSKRFPARPLALPLFSPPRSLFTFLSQPSTDLKIRLLPEQPLVILPRCSLQALDSSPVAAEPSAPGSRIRRSRADGAAAGGRSTAARWRQIGTIGMRKSMVEGAAAGDGCSTARRRQDGRRPCGESGSGGRCCRRWMQCDSPPLG